MYIRIEHWFYPDIVSVQIDGIKGVLTKDTLVQ
jgi:hypothetical protein